MPRAAPSVWPMPFHASVWEVDWREKCGRVGLRKLKEAQRIAKGDGLG
jgi:hypothetical protein